MSTIPTPSVQVYQQFTPAASAIVNPLCACVVGPNGQLHRYAVAAEKELISLGDYDPTQETCEAWPGITPGSVVDLSYVAIYIDNALLQYFENLIGDFSDGRGTVTVPSGYTNRVRSSTLAFKTGPDVARSALFYDRDVQIGDIVYVSGVESGGSCDLVELWTSVAGFASETVAAIVGNAYEAASNQPTIPAATASIVQTGGPVNCISATTDGAAYDGLAAGCVTEVYTLTVIQSSVAGCDSAVLQVLSASGLDNVAEETVAAFGSPTTIGTRGLTVTFDNTGNPSCSSSAVTDDVAPTQLVAGQIFTVSVQQAFDKVCAVSDGDYAGEQDDTYVITVTKGGTWEQEPQITVTTAKGLDFSGPTSVLGAGREVPIGTQGVTIFFEECPKSSSSSLSGSLVDFEETHNATIGLALGDTFYVDVDSSDDGRVSTLVLQNSVPSALRTAANLNLKLFIQDNIQVSENRLSDPPNVNWTATQTEVCLEDGITAYDPTWTSHGVELPLPVMGGTIYVQYREWLQALVGQLGAIATQGAVGTAIGGQAGVADNPLSYGVTACLAGARGSDVYFTAVSDPTSTDAWQAAIGVVDQQADFYNLVPLTSDAAILSLFQAEVDSESGPTTGFFSGMFCQLLAKSQVMKVGQSTAAAQLLTPTSTDGNLVLATVAANPQAVGEQYTLLEVPADNSDFVTYGVKPGDIVRFLFTTDAFSDVSYQEFIVDEVLSENALLLFEGTALPVTVPQKIEVWHTLTQSEVAADLVTQAQSYADTRVCAVWPDYVGQAGQTVPGYFLCCTLAGLRSSVVAQQPLTNYPVPFFDDYSRSSPFFNAAQLQTLENGGVWVVLQNSQGTAYTLHALTTNITDINHYEEMIRVVVDAASKYYQSQLAPFKGIANVTPSMISKLRFIINTATSYLQSAGYVDTLGPLLISATVVSIAQDPLLQDTIDIVLDCEFPSPLNVIRLYLIV